MSEPSAVIAAAWREGVGLDDRSRIDELAAAPGGALFAALARLAAGEPAELPPLPEAASERAVHAAIALRIGARAGGREQIARGVDALAAALAQLPDEDPRAAAARGWADLALGEVALLVGDRRVARQRFEAAAIPAAVPGAIRIAATRRLIDLAVERGDLEAARRGSARGLLLCEQHERPIEGGVLRRYDLLLSYVVGDLEGIRDALTGIGPDDLTVARLGPILLATTADDATALTIVTATLEEAMASGDLLLSALCLAIGARSHFAMGRASEAASLIERSTLLLRDVAGHLVSVIEALSSPETMTRE